MTTRELETEVRLLKAKLAQRELVIEQQRVALEYRASVIDLQKVLLAGKATGGGPK